MTPPVAGPPVRIGDAGNAASPNLDSDRLLQTMFSFNKFIMPINSKKRSTKSIVYKLALFCTLYLKRICLVDNLRLNFF